MKKKMALKARGGLEVKGVVKMRLLMDSLTDLYKDVTILVTLRQLPKPEKAQNLKYVHIFSAGINQLEDTDIVCFVLFCSRFC